MISSTPFNAPSVASGEEKVVRRSNSVFNDTELNTTGICLVNRKGSLHPLPHEAGDRWKPGFPTNSERQEHMGAPRNCPENTSDKWKEQKFEVNVAGSFEGIEPVLSFSSRGANLFYEFFASRDNPGFLDL